jgi:hypothetical protein
LSRLFAMPFARVYPLYVQRVERKGRTAAEVDEVIRRLTGFDDAELRHHLAEETTFEQFFAAAHLNRMRGSSPESSAACGSKKSRIR